MRGVSKGRSTWKNLDEVKATLKVLAEQLVECWRELGWKARIDPEGRPLVQVRLSMELPDGVRVNDVIVDTPEGKTLVVDVKTTAAPASEAFSLLAGQLAEYQLMATLEQNRARLGLKTVDGLVFFEAVKRKIPKRDGKGPTVENPVVQTLRSEDMLEKVVRSYAWTAESIRTGRFLRTGHACWARSA